MKRYRILMAAAVLAMAMTGCIREQFDTPEEALVLGKDDFAFSVGGNATKASAGEMAAAGSFKLGESGYYLEGTVENLNAGSVSTKGAPVYTENFRKNKTINVAGYVEGKSTPILADSEFKLVEAITSKHVYAKSFSPSFWLEAGDNPVWFFLRVDRATEGTNANPIAYRYDSSDGTIEFDYTSPKTAAAQTDIVFASRRLTSREYYEKYQENGGAPVEFHHALTGVKFRNGHENNNPTKTVITKVVIKGLKSTGTCTVLPSANQNGEFVEWEGLDNSTSFSQEFTNQAWAEAAGVDGTVTYTPSTSGANNPFGDSWYGSETGNSNTQNLNDKDGSLTFWFIPQEIDENVTLEVTFRVKTKDTQDGTEITHTINFGEKMNEGRDENVVWKAGELRTYTLKPSDVDVKIVDEMAGLKKSDLHVTNTGNVDEYVRIMVIGNWYGWETEEDYTSYKNTGKPEPDILVGYTTNGSTGDNTMVKPWFREDPDYGQYFDSSFTGGHPADGRTDWVRGTGSYFYFTDKIGPGEIIGDTDSATQPLFKSYELPADKIPKIYIPTTDSNVRVLAHGVHLKMEIVVQAILTTKPDGTEYADCWAAWSAATGKEIKEKPYTDD